MDKELLKIIIIAAVALALGGPTLVLAFRGSLAGITAGKDGVKLDLVTRIDTRRAGRTGQAIGPCAPGCYIR